jgi:hypothetical protein
LIYGKVIYAQEVCDSAHSSRQPPNTPMQLTPLRVPKILAFLKRKISLSVIPIYQQRRN